eukprot:TRINITY_DN1840_c0_g1_i2.p1 TRINITY_DN1840_c0_g1~~TRINITY_DN1840_c0_g1_i2.p1  ORF type:complete len:231 (+),score=33.07 TRINITY_DN1840_c0_g1_i2:592-1284(+)
MFSWQKKSSPKATFDRMINDCGIHANAREFNAAAYGESSPQYAKAAADLMLCQAKAIAPKEFEDFTEACGSNVESLAETPACIQKFDTMMGGWSAFWKRVWTPEAKSEYKRFWGLSERECRAPTEAVHECLARNDGDQSRCAGELGNQVVCVIRNLAPEPFEEYAQCMRRHPEQLSHDGPHCSIETARRAALDVHRKTLRSMGFTAEEMPDTESGRVYIEKVAPFMYPPE